MAQNAVDGARDGLNMYRDTYVAGNASVHQGDVYVSNADASDDIGNDKKKAKAGMQYRYHSIDSAVSETCQWFLEHEHYKTWNDDGRSLSAQPFLWLRGKPGSGKSTIMKRALADARSKAAPRLTGRPNLVASFFFNSRGGVLESTPEGFFRSVLHQIMEDEELDLHVEPLTTFLRKSRFMKEGWEWTRAELKTMFQAVVARGRLDLTLFIDALDECDATSNRDLVDFLMQELQSSQRNGMPFRICISSRHYPNIHLRDCRFITAEKHNDADVMTYLESQLQKIDHSMSSMSQEIANRSSGIFLWAVLVIRKLREATDDGESESTLRNILTSMPKGLEEVFRDLLGSIVDEQERSRSLSLFLFVLCAKRPMNLEQLGLALAFTKQYQSHEEYQTSGDFVAPEKLQRLITKRSRGLIEVSTSYRGKVEDGIVQFIHASVKEFLLDNSTLLLPHLSN